ncbi:hypothetical protein DFH08DRAFT_1043085 [Mycena albidolilacea]|uniref:Uncharacterized protein n=1 Tax=Mycena albidolilacea TaxID=1033008 RepID=A0AAD7AGL9_9AGAR|nr:hypothetical protein DFH08DRAFT_1043085 [Mycena albidolilacea]
MARSGAPTPRLLINYDTQMCDYLRGQNHVCNFDLNLTYPQTGGKLPYTPIKKGILDHRLVYAAPRAERRRRLLAGAARALARIPGGAAPLAGGARAAAEGVDAVTSALSSKSSTNSVKSTTKTSKLIAKATSTAAVNKFSGVPPLNKSLRGEINTFYGCDLLDAAMIYALNFAYPWNQRGLNFDFLDIPYAFNPISDNLHPHHWMNHNTTRAALHATHNKIGRVTTTTYSWGVSSSSTFFIRCGIQNLRSSTFFMDETQRKRTSASSGYSGNLSDVFR